MSDAVYFSKIEYREVIGYGNTSSIMLLNIPERGEEYALSVKSDTGLCILKQPTG